MKKNILILFSLTISCMAWSNDTIYFDHQYNLAINRKTDNFRVVNIDSSGYYDGDFKDYSNGLLIATGTYHHGKKDGIFTLYDTDGGIIVKGSYRAGVPKGEWYYYEGTLLKQLIAITDTGVVFEEYVGPGGESLDEKGNGDYVLEIPGIKITGKIKGYYMEGKWIKKFPEENYMEIERYRKGEFTEGKSINSLGSEGKIITPVILSDILFNYYFDMTEKRVTGRYHYRARAQNSGLLEQMRKGRKQGIADTLELPSGLVRIQEHYASDTLSMEGVYKRNAGLVAHGVFKFYSEEGNLEVVGHFEDGRPCGTWENFNSEGQMTDSFNYDERGRSEQQALTTDDMEETLFPDEEEVFFIVEDMPGFNGGGLDEFRKYIVENLRYPPEALKNKIQGRVFVQFTVNKNGYVEDIRVVRGAHPLLDKEAVRVITESPRWTPGRQRGKPVRVQFTFPIVFVL